MGLFGRRDKVADDEPGGDQPSEDSLRASSEASDEPASAQLVRTEGPWDESDDYPEMPRVDLGGILVPQSDQVRIQVQADQSTGAVNLVSLVTDTSAVQVQPYAAPRSGDMWSQVRGQIRSQINSSGGLVEETSGSFGVELRAQVSGQDGTAQPARFCGIEGPRWFVRLVFLGQAARDEQAAQQLEDVVRQVVVVRGDQAMPMGNALPLRLPAETVAGATPAPAPGAQRPTISLPERGPEITETR